MTRLSVNINKVALIRNSRPLGLPNIVQVALDCERFGAEGITVHPRPDERHIRYQDLSDLKSAIRTELNIEGYPDERFIQKVLEVKPAQVTLVPDSPDQLTSDHGWDTKNQAAFLAEKIETFKKAGIRVSIFLDPNLDLIKEAVQTGADCLEFYTEPYADHYHQDRQAAVQSYKAAASLAHELGFLVHAGHDLNLDNLAFLSQEMTPLHEVSIGHALITDALYMGFEKTISAYKNCLTKI